MPENASPRLSRRFGPYTLIRKLATGGMAEIWLASQKGLADFNRFVVIKKILPHLAEEEAFVRMFLDEARTSAQLGHPNIAQIYDLGREANTYFIAMEYIGGENLAAMQWRAAKKQIPLASAYSAKIVADAAKALHFAHQLRGANDEPLGIVHRDVSPQNILVTYEGEVKVVDFGIAKAASKSEKTKTGTLKGKFSYMSPEQCMGKPIDARADIFALGIVLYELVTGKRLFKHESELMILEMIARRPIPRPSELGEDVPRDLEAIIMRALEKAPEARYQTAQEMQAVLEAHLRSQRVSTASAEIAGYMRALFHDRIEEKRRTCEAAARNEYPVLEDMLPAEEDARALANPANAANAPNGAMRSDDAPKMPASASGLRPGRRPVGPGMPAGRPVMAPLSVPAPEGTAMAMPLATATMFTGVLDPPRVKSFLLHILIAMAAAVIVAGVAIIAFQPGNEPVPIRRGGLTIVSRPSGASVLVDGQPLTDAAGKPLATPVELKNLDYGSSYKIRLERAGTKPEERVLLMNEQVDKKEMSVVLEPRMGTIIANVVGEEPGRVEVFFGTERAGVGPTVKKELVPGTIAIGARAAGRSCSVEPETVSLAANTTEVTTVICKRAPLAKGAPLPLPRSSGGSECESIAGAAPGYATINSTPYADLYVGGKRIGQTPLSKKQLPAGCVILRAFNPDSKREKTVRLEIQPGTVGIYDIEL